ncbi:MAG: hypothetical protein KAS77_08235, partial [Thermoplasmata archaeon]|nr:hypothetical protein [Thermoplasmata archaeon]
EAGWLAIDQATGVLSGTPTNEDVGAYMVTLRVLDGRGGRDVRTFMLVVENTNDAPEITTTPVDRTEEDEVYTLFLEASDVDPTRDTFTWSLDTDADWLSLVGNRLTGVPENDDVGEYRVAISVEDGQGGNDSFEYTLTVRNTNDPPVVSGTPTHAREDEAYSFTMEAQDPDVGDALQWSLGSSVGWLSIDTGTGELAGTPTNDDVGSSFVMILVTDGTSEVSNGYTIVVTNTNDAPEWVTVPEGKTIDAGEPVVQWALAQDVDGDAVTYAIASEPAAEGLVIAVISGEIAWYETRAGTYQVTVTASDGDEEVEHTFTLTVSKVTTEEVEEGGTAFYAIILVLVVLVVVLVLKMMMGGGEGPAPVGEEKAGTEDEVADEDEVETDIEDEMVDETEEEQIIDP